MIEVEEFIADDDVSPFRRWFDDLDPQAAALVTIAIDRLGEGNTSNAKSLGEGVSELRINRGPGYRIYFGTTPAALMQTIQVNGAGISSYVVDNLAPATYYFAVRAYTSSGAESSSSNTVSKAVQ